MSQCEISPDTRMCAVASMGGFVGVYLVAVSQLGTAYKVYCRRHTIFHTVDARYGYLLQYCEYHLQKRHSSVNTGKL